MFKPTEEYWLPLMSTISLTWEKELDFHSSGRCCLHRQMQQGQTPERPNRCSGLSRRCRGRTLANSQSIHMWGTDISSIFSVSCWTLRSGQEYLIRVILSAKNQNVHLLRIYTGCISSLHAKIFSQILAEQTGKATDIVTGLHIGQRLSFNF